MVNNAARADREEAQLTDKSSNAATIGNDAAFNQDRLVEYLRSALPGFEPPLTIDQVIGGRSNPTYILSTPSKRYVLRKKPPGVLLPSAHQVDREYRVMRALAPTSVPVPEAVLLCQDTSIIGTDFFVMDFVDGRVFRDSKLPGMDPTERTAIYRTMANALADLHRADWKSIGLESFGKPANYIARQIALWSKQYEASKTDDVRAMDLLIDWLPKNIPADDETTIAHGDFRLENMIIHPSEPKVLAILDWELSTLGHPLSDLAYNCMTYHLPSYMKALGGFSDIDIRALGIPSEQEYLEIYCKGTGRNRIPDWNFFLAFALFRATAIMQGVYARSLQQKASGMDAGDVHSFIKPVSEIAWKLVS